MGDADNTSSINDDPAPEEDQHYYNALQTHLQTFLPFVKLVIDNGELLNILPNQVSKLRRVYNLVDGQRLSPDRLKNCKDIFYDLHDSYGNLLNYYVPAYFKTSWIQETKLNNEENNLSSDVRCSSNQSNQIQNTIEKNSENVKIGESSCSKNAIDDSMLAKNYLPKFSDGRQRLNNIIDFVVNDYIAKLNKRDASITHTGQIFDEMVKPKNDLDVQKNILNGINLDSIDINHVKDILESIKIASCVEPINPPPKPPSPSSDLMKLGESRRNLISTTEPNSSKVTQDNVLMSKSSTIFCEQLNTETNKLHETSSSNKTKQNLISALKPDTLIGLENSKAICASLHIDTLKPVFKSNKKNTDITSVAGISVPRNSDNSNAKLFETKAQEMSVYNGQSSSSNTNISLLNPRFSSKYNGNSIQFKNIPLSQNQKKYNHNNDGKNCYSRFNNLTQIHVNPSHTKPLSRHCDSVPHKYHSNDASDRDLRKLKSIETTQYSNSKEYSISKNKEQNKGYAKYKNQDQYRRLANEKMDKKIIGSYYSFGSVKETASIKNVKIPKIEPNKALKDNGTAKESKLKTFGDNKNNTDVLKTEKNSKIHLKADTIREQHLVDDQKSELNNSNEYIKDPKIADKINDSRPDKDLEIEITKNGSTNRDQKIKRVTMNNKSKIDDNCPETNLKETTVDIPSKVNKDELDSKYEQSNILMNHTDQNKPEKQKRYSKEKEFKKNVKGANENLNDDVWDLKISTRSILMNKEKNLKTLKLNNSEPKFEKDITVNSCKILKFGECSKNLDNVSIQNLEDVNGQIEIKHNITSFPSMEQSGVLNSTTTNILCESQEENIVSSNEVYSTSDNISEDKKLTEIFENARFINSKIKLLNKNKIDNLKKLLDDENVILDDNNFNQAENIVKTEKKNIYSNDLKKGITNSGNIYEHSSTDQHKLKSKKSYGHFVILKDKNNSESKELKIVIAKLDKNIKRENCNSDDFSNDKQTNNKPINNEKPQEIKPKKSFAGPLSVKLARLKMKMERNNSLNERDTKNLLEFETKKVKKEPIDGFDKKGKLNSETLARLITDQPTGLLRPFQNLKPFDDETNCNKLVEHNPKTSNFINNKPEIRKRRLSELEKLRADINEMFDCKDALNTSKIRQCRTNKQINYTNNNKKKKTSNIEQSETNYDQNDLICSVGKPKNTKNNIKKSTVQLKSKKQFVKKSMANQTLPPVVKNTVLNNISIKKEYNEQNIEEIAQESIIDESPSEISIYENQPDLIIVTNTSELTIDENPPESNIDENLPELVSCENLPVSAYDNILPDSNMLNIFPEQTMQSPSKEIRIGTEQPEIEYFKYTLKDKSKKFVLAGLSCESINSLLLFKCSVSNCQDNQFSTALLNNFSKHIDKYHQFVIWDGNCEACHHKLQIASEQYYVRNALEHLVSHHLIPNNNEQHPSTIGSKTQSLSSICQYKKSQRVEYSLRVRNLPGDRLSKHFIENSLFENSEQSSHNILLGNQSQTSVNLNINHGSNDERFPLLSSGISGVESLKKEKVNTSIINSNASDNNDLNMWLKAKTNCEIIPQNFGIFLEAGQQIVNNGVLMDSTVCLIDTAYRKDYFRKVRDFPLNVMKTRSEFNEMSALPRLLGLFKCMERSCTNIFTSKELFKLHMQLHFSNAEKKKKNKINNVEQFKMCAYCFKVFDDEESLANHIAEKYTFCEYFCPHCFYRAYTASHVLVHQSVVHTYISKACIIKLEYHYGALEYPKEMLLAVDFKEFVLPYKCNIGCCGFSCYLHNEFVEHLNQEHKQCGKFYCYICASKNNGEVFFSCNPISMILHMKLHNLDKYQCIFCLFGSEIIDSVIKHLAFEHFEYEPLCLERSIVSDNCDSKNIGNLKILRLKKVIENDMVEIVNLPVETIFAPEVWPRRSKKRSIKCSDIPSVVMKSARIDEGSQPSDTLVNTVPDSTPMAKSSTSMSLGINNELIMIDDVKQNNMKESLKITSYWSESNNKKKEANESSNDDIIVIDDEDDVVLSEKEELNKDDKKQICIKIEEPYIELDKLFVCKKCDKVLSNCDMYFAHLKVCPFWDRVTGFKCIYCVKVLKTALHMTEHMKLHGPDRFECYLCNLKEPSEKAIRRHMKNYHRINNIDILPEFPNLTDLNKDNFIVLEDNTNYTVKQKKKRMNKMFTCNKCSFMGNTYQIIISHIKAVHNAVDWEDNFYKIPQKQPNDTNNSINSIMTQQNTSLNKKHSFTNFGNQKGSLKAKPIIENKSKNLFFSPDTIDSIPNCHIFSDPIGCLLCKYITKVRSNLIVHLNGHTIRQDNVTKDIFNLVPSNGKSKLMVDKIINLSSSSIDAMNTEIIKRDELNKKIVEVALDDSLTTEIFPQFIPKNIRYKCSIPLCTYTGGTGHILKKHMSRLHPTYEYYICPHCLPRPIILKGIEHNQIEFHLMHHGSNLYRCQYCDYIDFNRVEVRRHMRNEHLFKIASSVQSKIIVIRQTKLEDDSIDRASLNVPQWVCNICSSGLRYTENEIIPHIVMVHKVSSMFKCPMCQFENNDDNPKIFEEHYKLQHPSIPVKCLRVFEKISDNEDLHTISKHLSGMENMLEHLTSKIIKPTPVPTFRGISIESTPLTMYSQSRGMSNSPKSATNSQCNMLLTESNKNNRARKSVIVDDKRTSYSKTKEKNIVREKKVLVPQPEPDTVSQNDIINLVDDSDDE